jgi:hypothetical protein
VGGLAAVAGHPGVLHPGPAAVYGVPIQDISDTVGHKSTHVTETVYRHVIVPQIRGGAAVMDAVFGDQDDEDGDDYNKEAKTA